MRPKRLNADGAEKGSGGHGGPLWESREKPPSEAGSSAAVRVGLEQGSQLAVKWGWGGVGWQKPGCLYPSGLSLAQILALPPCISCVTFNKFLNLSEPPY